MTEKSKDTAVRFLELSIETVRSHKRFAERVFEQLETEDFHKRIGENTNSIYIIAKHISGNLRSRWTDFLTSDGEKPTRKRDREFEEEARTKEDILAMWEAGWKCLLDTLYSLSAADLDKTVHIRAEPHSVMQAVIRASNHIAQHVGQIAMLARHFRGDSWKWLTIAPGESEKHFRKTPK